MRTYIIDNDGIALCRETPAAVNDGEMVVSSKEELLAAPLNGKRLLALWNALPGVDKRRRVGDRAALIEQLWSAIERLPEPEPRGDPKRPSKQDVVIAMLRQPEGATVDEVASVTGWQRHTVRRRLLGKLEEKARARAGFSQRGTRPRVPHRRAGERMRPPTDDASARQHPGEPSPVPGRGGNRTSRPASKHVAEIDGHLVDLLNRSTQELRLAWRELHRTGPPQGSVAIC